MAIFTDIPPKSSSEEVRKTAKLVLLNAFRGSANIHREIIKRGKDEFLMQCERHLHGYGLSLTDYGDLYHALVATRPPWLHEMPDGTILDEQGNIVAPDEDDLAAAEKVLAAAKTADDLMAQLRASARASH